MKHSTSLLFVAGAYTLWGILPLYWHYLAGIPGPAIVGVRILCSLLFLTVMLRYHGILQQTAAQLLDRKRLIIALPSALLVVGNWLIYLWAMTHGQMLEAGLGYFLCPILTMVLATVVLGESLSLQRMLGAGVIAIGVLSKVLLLGTVPWVGLGLAISFASYLVIRKRWPVEPFTNMFHEMVLLAPLGLLLLMVTPLPEIPSISTSMFLLLTGPITVLPMAALVSGMRTVSLQTGALLQYLNPGLTMAMGLLMGESLQEVELLAYGVIFLGVVVAVMPSPVLLDTRISPSPGRARGVAFLRKRLLRGAPG